MSSDAVKRIMAEVRELSVLNAQPGTLFRAAPMESDLFEWHFTVRGPPDTPFEGGLYHGRIILPAEYPLKAPEIILLTPNGRFEVGTRICLSVTSHHNETWQPSWGVRTILTALIGFMPSKSEGLGALDYPSEDRRALARKSLTFQCPRCGVRPADELPSALAGPADAPSEPPASVAAPPVPTLAAPTTSPAADEHAADQVRPAEDGGNLRESAERPMPAGQLSIGSTEPTAATAMLDRQPLTAGSENTANIETRKAVPRNESRRAGQERELLYLAYAIAVAIFAIVARRLANISL